MERSLVFPFAGAAHQYRENPIYVRHLPFLSDAGNRHTANGSPVGGCNDPVGRGRDNLQYLRPRARPGRYCRITRAR